jgi:hypothetical protein
MKSMKLGLWLGLLAVAGSAWGGTIDRVTYNSNAWDTLSSPLRQYAEFPSMAVYSNALYLMGGKGLTNVYRYADGTWTEVAGLPQPTWGAAAGTVGRYLYLAGGMNAAGNAVTNQMYRFDGTSWTRIADMTYPRGLAAGADVNGKFHVFGGLDEVGALPTTSLVFDGTNWSSQTFGVVFGLRLAAATVGTNVYVSGGYYGGYQIWFHRLVVTNAQNQMAYGSQTFMPNGRAYHASAALDDKVYVIGGRVGGSSTNGSWCYSFTNRLADPPAMPQALDSIAAATYGGSIYVTGGSILNNTTNVYRYPAQSGRQGVVPNSGIRNGGYEVRITGTGLGNGSDVTNVTLCGVNAHSIVSQSATQVVVVAGSAPGDVTGAVQVFSTSAGISEQADAFTYSGTGKDFQEITFAEIADQVQTNALTLSATASSGLAVSFSVVSGPATLGSGNRLTFSAPGAVTVRASQAGNASYDPAPNVDRSFRVLSPTPIKLTAVALTNSVILRWPDPQNNGFGSSVVNLRYAADDYPATTNAGTGIFTGTNQTYQHTGRASGQACYYSIFVSDDGIHFVEP